MTTGLRSVEDETKAGSGSKDHDHVAPSWTRMLWQANRTESPAQYTSGLAVIGWAMGAGVKGKSACQMPLPLSPTRNTASRWKGRHSYGAQRAGNPVPKEVQPLAAAARWCAPVVDTTTVPTSPRQTTSRRASPSSPSVGSCPGLVQMMPPSTERRMSSSSARMAQTSSSFAGFRAISMLLHPEGRPVTVDQVVPPSSERWSVQLPPARTTA